ncbi:hypothetical protein [Sulfuricurvum sp.]|uniref:hypothetical protein n=1 Tax=Sulfuricurvum sp. TaxID=2025608 RepID=UPI0026197CE6|nr:hypothetical protein [Sulfuricurvum sp.]MDD2267848.1 hypothetical protein [Sulfuricurvum sp.]
MNNILELEAKYQELGKEIEKLKAKECGYPKFFRHRTFGYIVKFTSLEYGELMTKCYGACEVGHNYGWTAHTDKDVWEEIPYDKITGFYHKQLVWCWDNDNTHAKVLRFYDATNGRAFNDDGKSHGCCYDNYKPYDWSCAYINKWAIEAVKTLEDK